MINEILIPRQKTIETGQEAKNPFKPTIWFHFFPMTFRDNLPSLAREHGAKMPSFADDMTLYCSHTSAALACSTVSAALKDTSRALALRGLSINVSKTVAMVIAPHFRACQGLPTDVRLLLQNEEVKLVSQTRLLGIIIDDSLCWSPHVHVDSICKKVGRKIREVLQTESGSIFGKVRVRVLTSQGQSTHEHVRTESLFCKQKIDFRFSFSVRPVPMAKRLGTFKKILAESLLLSSHKVTKWSWRGRTSFFFFTLACFARQGGAGLIINEVATELFYTRESRKREAGVNGKGTNEKEDYLYVDDSWRRLLSLCFLPVRTKYTFFRLSHDTVRGRDRWFRNSLEFGAGEHTGKDEIDAVELGDLENDDIAEEETNRAEVDAASCNPKLPSTWPHGQTRTGQPEPNRKFCSVPGPSSRTFGWIFAKMRHFVSHLSPGHGPFPSKFPNFGLQNVPIAALRRVYRQLSPTARRQFFVSVIQPDLEYAASATIPFMPTGQRDRLLALWRKAVRCLADVHPQDDVLPLIENLKLTLLSHRWSLQLFTTIRRCHQQSGPALLLEKLHFHEHQHGTRGRQQGDFRPYQPASLTGRNSFTNRAPLLWNMLPREVQTSSSMFVFELKKKVLSLLDSPVSGKNLLQISFGNTTI